jgi:hypothetical protein
LLQELIHIRRTAVSLRNEGRALNDEVLRQIEHELDLSEIRLSLIAPGRVCS